MILEVSGKFVELVGELVELAEANVSRLDEELVSATSLRLELSGAEVELEELDAIQEELVDKFAELAEVNVSLLEEVDSGMAKALLPSSPQATNPIATNNTPNKPRYFIFRGNLF